MSERALKGAEEAIRCLTETIKAVFGDSVTQEDKDAMAVNLRRLKHITKRLQALASLTDSKPKSK
jgi:hypothetical protein